MTRWKRWIPVAGVFLACSCAGFPSPEKAEESRLRLPGFSVYRPPGADWEISVEADKGKISGSRTRRDYYGRGMSQTILLIQREKAGGEGERPVQEAMADLFRRRQADGLRSEGEKRGFTFQALQNGMDTVDGKTCFTMSYRLLQERTVEREIEEYAMYIYFPEGYGQTGEFLVFAVGERFPRGGSLFSPDLDLLRYVIGSLRWE